MQISYQIEQIADKKRKKANKKLRKNDKKMQNEPNLKTAKISIKRCLVGVYIKNQLALMVETNPKRTQFKPNTNPIKPQKAKNEPNSNPKQTQFSPLQSSYLPHLNIFRNKNHQRSFWRLDLISCNIGNASH